jgi:hypothetical protein
MGDAGDLNAQRQSTWAPRRPHLEEKAAIAVEINVKCETKIME